MSKIDLDAAVSAINRLRLEKEAIILAHNYQIDAIQDVADIVGDSLALSQAAAKTKAKVIVFCGVHFMAESASILALGKTVLLPAADAGCPMAEMADAPTVLKWRQDFPKAAVITYINSTAAVKAVSDYCCTSANAVTLVRNIPERELIFLPDQNLGRFVASQVPEKIFHLWPGYCVTHHRVTAVDLYKAKTAHPDALILVHPECREEVTTLADFVGSTSQIASFVRQAKTEKFIIGTEMGIIHSLQKENPDKTFYLLSQGLVCPNMKQTTISKLLAALTNLTPVITVEPAIRVKAKQALDRMLEFV